MNSLVPVNALLWLAASDDHARTLRGQGYSQASVEVLTGSGSDMPIDVVVRNPTTLKALAAECKTGKSADFDQYQRYLALDAELVSEDFGAKIDAVCTSFMILDEHSGAFLASINDFDEEVDHIPWLVFRDGRVALYEGDEFEDNSLNVVFSGDGQAVPVPTPEYLDLMPDSEKREVRRFCVTYLVSEMCRVGRDGTFEVARLAARCRSWSILTDSGQAALVKKFSDVLQDLRSNELNGVLVKPQKTEGIFKVARDPRGGNSGMVIAQALNDARTRWGLE